MPTSVARVSIKSRSARAARRRCVNISPPAAYQAQRMRTISYGKERPGGALQRHFLLVADRRAVTVLNQSS
jgi:hypothetical protein